MARYYNCKCGDLHPIGEPCPNKNKYNKDHLSEKGKKANNFYKSKVWKDKREEIKSLDKGLCQRCLIKFGIITTNGLEIHHIEPLNIKWEKRLQNDNLITLCKQCHIYLDKRNNGELDFEWTRMEKEWDFEFR